MQAGAERLSSAHAETGAAVSKLLFLVLIAFAVYWLLRSLRSKDAADRPPAPRSPEAMVSCARCGLHIPRSESIEAAGRHYCCQEHRRLDAGDTDRD